MGKLFDIIRNKPIIGVGLVGLAGLGFYLAFFVFGFQAAFIDDVASEEEIAANQDLLDSFQNASGDAEGDSEEDADSDSEASDASDNDPGDTAPGEQENTATTVAGEDVTGEDDAGETATETTESLVEDEPTTTQAPTTAAPANVSLSGTFVNAPSYDSEGSVEVLGNGSETRVFLLNDFATDNGPDLKVYLRAANGEFISLGDLQNNIGASNYLVPPGTDLSVYNTVEIWCERFGGEFGSAPIA